MLKLSAESCYLLTCSQTKAEEHLAISSAAINASGGTSLVPYKCANLSRLFLIFLSAGLRVVSLKIRNGDDKWFKLEASARRRSYYVRNILTVTLNFDPVSVTFEFDTYSISTNQLGCQIPRSKVIWFESCQDMLTRTWPTTLPGLLK